MDVTKNCKDCKQPFTVTSGEQQFYKERGWELPERCKGCRDKRKEAKAKQEGRK